MNPHSRLASFYRHFYLVGTLPNNLCLYFWSLLLAIVITPFVFSAMISNWFNKQITYHEHKEDEWGYTSNFEWVILEPKLKQYYSVNPSKLPTSTGLILNIIFLAVGALIINLMSYFLNNDLFKIFSNINSGYFVINLIVINLIIIIIGLVSSFIIYYSIIFSFIFLCDLYNKIKGEDKKIDDYDEIEKQYIIRRNALIEKKRYRSENPNFIRLCFRWLKAKKDKNCPILKWDYDIKKNK